MSKYTGNDIYCDVIIARKVDISVVAETENVLAYHHTRPHTPVHIAVTCKQHVASILDLGDELALELLGVVKQVAKAVQDQEGGCHVITNLGEYQSSKHLHIHITSGRPLEKQP